ncbi:MAG: alpha/beta fold hydrolase, partial [Candidatus Hydrogenedentes bacterium]|nr:alpha/beta fold hydrolase [Candidatus Hydrogenedentota bacterium]
MRKKMSMWLLILLTLVFILLLGRAYFFQDDLIFPRTSAVYRNPADAPFLWDYEDIYVDVKGEKTHGWLIPLEGARGFVLFSHGNAGNIADRLESIQLLRDMGFSVLAYDYGGYGYSEGRPSEDRIYADAEGMWQYLTETRGIAPGNIVIFGRSLGGAAAAHLATKAQAAAVILESTFTSIPDVVRTLPLGSLLALCIRHELPSIEKV